ncbi:MAG: tryptophan synthase subunit alpha [Capsulimonadaceae bacterium]
MTSRITNVFARLRERNEAALVTFLTAGDPDIDGTPARIALLARSGADIVELGIPYSDPLADGPTIQASSQRALDRGITPPRVLELTAEARRLTDVPIVLMTSYNLVLVHGLARFASDAVAAGVDGMILTDLPPDDADAWRAAAGSVGLATIFLMAPTSTAERLRIIGSRSTGFVYCVSRTGVTGARAELPDDLMRMLASARAATTLPLCVGFGVSTRSHVAQVAAIADGAVIGSALVDFYHRHASDPDCDRQVSALVAQWKAGTRRPA